MCCRTASFRPMVAQIYLSQASLSSSFQKPCRQSYSTPVQQSRTNLSQQSPSMRYPTLQPQVDTPPAPPGGRWPPRIALADPPERPTCKQHPESQLSAQEIAYGYTRCLVCRDRESALAAAMESTASLETTNEVKEKPTSSFFVTVVRRVRSMFAQPKITDDKILVGHGSPTSVVCRTHSVVVAKTRIEAKHTKGFA